MNLLKWNTGGSAKRKVCATEGGKFAKRVVMCKFEKRQRHSGQAREPPKLHLDSS